MSFGWLVTKFQVFLRAVGSQKNILTGKDHVLYIAFPKNANRFRIDSLGATPHAAGPSIVKAEAPLLGRKPSRLLAASRGVGPGQAGQCQRASYTSSGFWRLTEWLDHVRSGNVILWLIKNQNPTKRCPESGHLPSQDTACYATLPTPCGLWWVSSLSHDSLLRRDMESYYSYIHSWFNLMFTKGW